MRAMPNRWKPNVTVAAIIERAGHFLLVEEHTRDGLKLNNPAGHLDPGESPQAACVREVLEETAHGFTPTALVGIYLNRFTKTGSLDDLTYLRFAFTGHVGAHYAERALDTGIVRAVWLTAEELRACPERHRSPLLLRSLEDYLAGQRFQQEMGAIASAYLGFARRWNTADALRADEAGFRADANLVLRQVYERMQRENHDFYPRIEAMEVAAAV